MGQSPSSDEEWTIHSLNIHGNFFQNKVASIVNNYDPKNLHFVTSEYPVEFPPGNHRDESRLDILGWIPSRYRRPSGIYLIIECKKANPEFVDWIFYPKIQNQLWLQDDSRVVFLRNCSSVIRGGETKSAVLDFTGSKNFSISISGECREVRGSYENVQRNSKTKTSNSSITDAAYQVTLATHSIAMEHYELNKKDIDQNKAEAFNIRLYVYVPIILTTANLYMIEYTLDDVDSKTGEIPYDKAKLNPVERLFYEYPIPPHLQTVSDENCLTPYEYQKNDRKARRNILIVNAKHFENSLRTLINQG